MGKPIPVRYLMPHTPPPPAMHDPMFPTIMRLRADNWEHALKDAGIWDKFSDIPEGLRKGFHCG
jgi:hypothetical protein